MSDAWAYASVSELAAAYRSGRVTPLDVVSASLARAEALEPQLNATRHLMRDAALEAADAATRELREGRDRGPLHGVPVAIKDLIDVAGAPTTYASRAVDPRHPATDAALVRRLREAGAAIVAKTNLLEFAYGVAHPDIGQTCNPWDTSRTSGGSSGGSAALVSAGVAPLAVGTDTGGSIRIPASYCGIVGLKPSFDLAPTQGVFPLSWSLDHAGPLARSARDAAALLAAMSGRDMPLASVSLAGLRIGVVGVHMDSPYVSAGVRDVLQVGMERLAQAGAILTPVEIPEAEEANRALISILLPEASLIHERIVAARPQGYASGTRAQIEAGFSTLAVDYVRAQRLRARLRDCVQALFADVDVLLSPATPFVAPREDPLIEGDDGGPELLSSGLGNMTGHPALSLPFGLSEGLPVGGQLMAAAGEDAFLLSVAAAMEALLGPIGRPAISPRPPAGIAR
jgi:aspartyl-tRNA(Asn)/glutamyl-tRNA(Gln) amidotransferase subunit A